METLIKNNICVIEKKMIDLGLSTIFDYKMTYGYAV